MLDPFYLIVDHPRWLERLLPVGVRLVQLRMKDLPQAELRALVRQGRDLAQAHGAQLIVNDYWRLALEEGCDFVHLGQEDLAEADLAAIRAAGLKLGISTHDDAELDRALATEPDYVALGPIFPTILKQMRWAPQGLERIGAWKRRIGQVPLVAIGGLTPERGTAALAAGADSVAVVTDVLLNADPEARCREWLDVTRQPA
ncbi:MAG TPA: thiamine phosphate synthase [Geminicoccus sp.]|uniref:thiamine phosphate synthase n=1 Tax=Geminicoccus sp. TaxID=2024832 RepID=UPI002C494519|nr:thiamine phosphate synthase [Geminicoccus sp.]HWL66869.1 thiamine phosphate synthase [Geminicoccus sp.]